MSWRRDGPPADDEPLGRPFLTGSGGSGGPAPAGVAPPGGRHGPAGSQVPAPQVPGPGETSSDVRPYLLTGGRTQVRGARIAMETVVLATGMVRNRPGDAAGLERARILRLCERPCSAAEVAARLHLPLAVALVLVTDLVADGLLEASMVAPRQADDVLFLERLIAGVAAL